MMLDAARRFARHLPPGVKRAARRLAYGGGHPDAPSVRTAGTIQDLYFWIADGQIDTIIPLQNYFSVFFPDKDTSTTAEIEIYGFDGRMLGTTSIALPHLATPMIRVSELLARVAPDTGGTEAAYGNLVWHISVPGGIAERIGPMSPLLFWDRLYIGYVAAEGGACFMHGVDKYDVRSANNLRLPWTQGSDRGFTARPEIPIDVSAYAQLQVIVQNRASETRAFRLEVADHLGQNVEWTARVASRGAHRFVFSHADTRDLAIERPLALCVSGLPTRYGRPILLKRFKCGALSIMHC